MQAGMENGFIDHGVFHSSAVGGDLAAHASLTGLAISTADLFFRCRAESVTNERASGRQGKFMRVANQQATRRGGGAAAFGIKYSLLYPPQGYQETGVWGRTEDAFLSHHGNRGD